MPSRRVTHRTPPPSALSPYFLVRITADSDTDLDPPFAANTYGFQEAWRSGGVWALKDGGRYGTQLNPGVPLPGLVFAVGEYALCRSAEGEGGLVWELLALPAGDAGVGAGTAAPGCGWTAGLLAADCVAATVLSALGRCGCPNPRRVIDCAHCPNGAPGRWEFALAGGSGDFAGAAGDGAVAFFGGCVWTGALGDWAASLRVDGPFGSDVAVLTLTGPAGAQLVYTSSTPTDCCGPLTFTLFSSTGTGTPPGAPTLTGIGQCQPLPLASTDGVTWDSGAGTLTVCGQPYTVSFTRNDCAPPCLKLTSAGGSGAVEYQAVWAGCGANSADFTLYHPAVCTHAANPVTGPAGNVITIRVAWPCPAAAVPDDCDADFCPGEAMARNFSFQLPPIPDNDAACGPGVGGSTPNCSRFSTDSLTGDPRPIVLRTPFNLSSCYWGTEVTSATCLYGGTVILEHVPTGNKMRLSFADPIHGAHAVYKAPMGSWDCMSALTLTKVSEDGPCTGFPDTITIVPV